MDAARFEEIVAAYGAEPRRWPEAERADAEAFAARPEAASMMAEAGSLDALLDASAEITPLNLAFVRRVIAAAPKPTSRLNWRPAAALAASALIGMALGFGGARQAAEAHAAAAVLDMAFAEGGEG